MPTFTAAFPKPRSVSTVAMLTLLYIPFAFAMCCHLVNAVAFGEHNGLDFGHAVSRSHLPASLMAVGLSAWSMRRTEPRHWLSQVLLTCSCLWVAFSFVLGK